MGSKSDTAYVHVLFINLPIICANYKKTEIFYEVRKLI